MKRLENMPTVDKDRDRMARCTFYLSLLLNLAQQKIVTRKCERSGFLLTLPAQTKKLPEYFVRKEQIRVKDERQYCNKVLNNSNETIF